MQKILKLNLYAALLEKKKKKAHYSASYAKVFTLGWGTTYLTA